MTHQNNATLSRKRHHPTHPQPAAHTPAWLPPATAPSFKDLPRQTRSPLRMTHPKPSALFSKKALNLFSWSAASLATIAVLSSYGTPAFGHHIRYGDVEPDHPYSGAIFPICDPETIKIIESGIYPGIFTIYRFGLTLHYSEVIEIRNPGNEEIRYNSWCHEKEDNSPYLTEEITLIRDGTNPDILRYYFDLDRHFTDPDGDSLTYSAESSDPSAIRVEVSGNRLILTLSSKGATATIKVTADDGENTTTTSFDVVPPNEPPRATGSIPNQTFLASGGVGSSELCNLEEDTKFNTDLSSLFNDPNDDELTYEVIGSPSWLSASISGSTLDLNALQSAVEGDSTTITVTASDGKDDGDASLSFNVNIVAEKTPKPILSKNTISLELIEVPPTVEVSPDQRIPVAQDSYSVTLSCQYRFPVTVEISNTPGSLEIRPTTLRFNETNWNVPQTVRVKTVGTTPGSFILPHTAVTTNSEGKTVRESDNLSITVTYEEIESALEGYLKDKDLHDELARRAEKEIKNIMIGATIGSVVPGVGTAAGAGIGGIINKLDTAWEVGEVIGDFLLNNNEIIDSGEEFNRLAENLYIHHEALQNGTVSFDQAFSGQTFSFPFNLSQASAEDQESSPRFNALISSEINFSRISDSTPNLDFDGSATFYGLGLSVIPNPEVPLITGLQFGYTQSNSDFEYLEALEGTYDLRMFSVSPFIAWDATDSLTVWSAIGYGRPNTETTIDSIVGLDFDSTEEEEVSYSSSGDFFSFAGGANYRVWQSDLSALSLNLSGSTTSFLDNDSKEGSISAQFSHNFPFNSGQLKTSADLALILSDSGPSATELSGNLNWLPNKGRLSGSTNARVLLFGGDRSEWGIGGSVTLLPGERGEGLSLALRPSFGQTNTALSNLHLDPFSFSDPTELALSTAPLTARFNAELAYGFPSGNHALLTPYTKLSMGHYGTTTSAGLRYQLDNSLDLDFSASHRHRSSGNNDNRFFLQLRSDL